jgi:hypothetical protein
MYAVVSSICSLDSVLYVMAYYDYFSASKTSSTPCLHYLFMLHFPLPAKRPKVLYNESGKVEKLPSAKLLSTDLRLKIYLQYLREFQKP